ncbi:hypothetical protein HK102_013737, partial [Quaeritorhiza haematococci]
HVHSARGVSVASIQHAQSQTANRHRTKTLILAGARTHWSQARCLKLLESTDWSLFRLLVETGQVDPDVAGGRALHYASCADSDRSTTRFLLGWGAKTTNKRIDLNCVVDLNVLEILLAHGMKPNNKTRGPPINFMRKNCIPRIRLLMRYGADLGMGNRWKSVLYCFGTKENADMIHEILSFECFPRQTKVIGRVLQILSEHSRYDALEILLSSLTLTSALVEMVSSVLRKAVADGNTSLVRLGAARFPGIVQKDTMIFYRAFLQNHEDIGEILLASGAAIGLFTLYRVISRNHCGGMFGLDNILVKNGHNIRSRDLRAALWFAKIKGYRECEATLSTYLS